MIGFCRRIALGLAFSLAVMANCSAAGQGGQGPSAADPTHQILVLLRLPPEHFSPNGPYADAYTDGFGQIARRRTAGRLARAYGLTLVSDWPMPLLGVDRFVIAVPAGQSPEAIPAILSRDSGVGASQPMHLFHVLGGVPIHNDPLLIAQPAARELRLAELHQMATGRGEYHLRRYAERSNGAIRPGPTSTSKAFKVIETRV